MREILRACRLHSAGQRIPRQPALSLPRIAQTSPPPDLFQISIENKSKLESWIEGKKDQRNNVCNGGRLKYRIEYRYRIVSRGGPLNPKIHERTCHRVYIYMQTKTHEDQAAKKKINGLPSFVQPSIEKVKRRKAKAARRRKRIRCLR